MKVYRYQWVGLLAGLPLFSGAWLAAYYNNEWWGVLGLLVASSALWVAVKVERRSTATNHMIRGLRAGLLAGVSARAAGVLALALSDYSVAAEGLHKYGFPNDMFRSVLNGRVASTMVLIVVMGVVGVMASWFEPAIEQTANTTERRKK